MKHVLMVLLLSLISTNLFASLADNEDSVKLDHQKFSNLKRHRISNITKQTNKSIAAYSIHEFIVDSIRVHEFTNAKGKVFAVAWKGDERPDLSVLLGANFAKFKAGEKAQIHNLSTRYHPEPVLFDDVKVDRGGISGAMWGRAYLIDELPAGLSAKDLI